MSEYYYVNTNELFGSRIKKFRKDINMTQAELAKNAGLSRKHISDAERGLVSLNANDICNIAQALSKDAEDIISTAQFSSLKMAKDVEVKYVKMSKPIKPYNHSPPAPSTD